MSIAGVVRMSSRPSAPRARMAALSFTPAATSRLREIMNHALPTRANEPLGVRLGVRERGCSGKTYYLDYADKRQKNDEVIEAEGGVKVFVDPSALLYVIGTEMDYKESDTETGFVFSNPNITATCGCGESAQFAQDKKET